MDGLVWTSISGRDLARRARSASANRVSAMPTSRTAARMLPNRDRRRSRAGDPVVAVKSQKGPASAGGAARVPDAAARVPCAWSGLQAPGAPPNEAVRDREPSFREWGSALRSAGLVAAVGPLAARPGDWPRTPHVVQG